MKALLVIVFTIPFAFTSYARNCPDGEPNEATITGSKLVAKISGVPITSSYVATAHCGLPIMYAWNKPQNGMTLAACGYTWYTKGTRTVSCTITTFSYGSVSDSLSVLVGTATYKHASCSPGATQDGAYITHIPIDIGPGESRTFSQQVITTVGCDLGYAPYVGLQALHSISYTAAATISYPPAPIGDGVSAMTGHCDVYESKRSVSIEEYVDNQYNNTQTGWDYSPYANVKAVIWD